MSHLRLVDQDVQNLVAAQPPVSKPTAAVTEFLSAHADLFQMVPDDQRRDLARKVRRHVDAYRALLGEWTPAAECSCWSGGSYCADCQRLADGKEPA